MIVKTGDVFRHVLMGIQMILAVFQAAFTFGTVPELQIGVILLRAAADCTSVDRASSGHSLDPGFEIVFPLHLPGPVALIITGHSHKQDHIDQGQNDLTPDAGRPFDHAG